MAHRGFTPIIIAIFVLLAIVLIGGGYMIYKNRADCFCIIWYTQTPPAKIPTQVVTQKYSGSTIDTSGWKTYTNTQYRFSFEYPAVFSTYTDTSGYVVIADKNNTSTRFQLDFSFPLKKTDDPINNYTHFISGDKVSKLDSEKKRAITRNNVFHCNSFACSILIRKVQTSSTPVRQHKRLTGGALDILWINSI